MKIPLKNDVEQKQLKLPKTSSQLGLNHYNADGPSISERTDIQPLHHKLWNIFFLSEV